MPIYLSIHRSIYLCNCLSIYLISVCVHLCIHPSVNHWRPKCELETRTHTRTYNMYEMLFASRHVQQTWRRCGKLNLCPSYWTYSVMDQSVLAQCRMRLFWRFGGSWCRHVQADGGALLQRTEYESRPAFGLHIFWSLYTCERDVVGCTFVVQWRQCERGEGEKENDTTMARSVMGRCVWLVTDTVCANGGWALRVRTKLDKNASRGDHVCPSVCDVVSTAVALSGFSWNSIYVFCT